MRSYGIDYDRYISLLNEQGHVCALCGGEGFLMKGCHRVKLVVDHCHQTGRVRGLLCHNCNRALGLLQDDPAILRAAIDYLKGGIRPMWNRGASAGLSSPATAQSWPVESQVQKGLKQR
ncbi:endonuclease VII domain-containing protein [Cupriavidus sp. H18C1]|uniref:endonuclease VII domain-containing protein n=1 Tax=Cupriavidus sp. H18C1 TaxID=3241601 RepID=UPI003BB98DE1